MIDIKKEEYCINYEYENEGVKELVEDYKKFRTYIRNRNNNYITDAEIMFLYDKFKSKPRKRQKTDNIKL